MAKIRFIKVNILFLGLLSLAPVAVSAQRYKHKSEGEIARLTPAQLVDQWVNEQVHHRYDLSDDQGEVIKKYVLHAGLKSLPRMIEIMDEYDPAHLRKDKGRRGERFDACWLMLGYLDSLALRLRASQEGRTAMATLKRAINRMQAAGAERKQDDAWEWVPHGRFDGAVACFKQAEGINDADEAIRNSLRLQHQIRLSDANLLEFSNFLVTRDPTYPSWSQRDFIKIEEAGKPMPGLVMKNLRPFYQAYIEFKRIKR
jgi:hypothetical protein